MIRPVTVSMAILCGLFIAESAAAKNPNIPNPKIVAPNLPPTSRMLVAPRNINGIRSSLVTTDTQKPGKRKAKRKKIVIDSVVATRVKPRRSPNDPRVPDKLRDVVIVFGGDARALGEIKEILDGLADGDNSAFGGPLATMFPGHQAADPKPVIPGTGGHTTGQHEGSDNPGHQLDEILARFAEAGGSGDDRGPDGSQSNGEEPDKIFGSDRGNSTGSRGIGAFDSGLPDPSGEASQDRRGGWASCGSGCIFRWTEVRRGGRVVANREERRDQTGTTTKTTNSRTGTTETRFRSRHWAYESYRSVSHIRADGQQMIEVRDYDNPRMDDVIITSVVGPDGGWEESSREAIPEVEQPAPDGAPVGGGPRGGAFYRVVCGGMVCTYTALSKQEVAVNFGPIQVNPGHVDNEDSLDTGPRVGPGAVTDPDPDGLGLSPGGGRPLGRGCRGMIRC
jgi:hypothetical protein